MTPPVSSSGVAPPEARLRQWIAGHVIQQLISVVAKLNVADHLVAGPKSVECLAEAVAAESEPLYRILRALASQGIFRELEERVFVQSPLSEILSSQSSSSVRPWAILAGEPWYRDAWSALHQNLLTGTPSFELAHGAPAFDYFVADPEAGRCFQEAMGAGTEQVAGDLLRAYDFSRHATLVDVGGGYGALLGAILQAHAEIRGILYDLAPVVAEAPPVLDQAGVVDRCLVLAGSFFDKVPGAGDAYILKWILHDWPDEESVAILRNCRAAMPPHARLLVIERLINPGAASASEKLGDVVLMVLMGGVERTEAQFAGLFERAGLSLVASRDLGSSTGLCLLEAIPV